jgi:hypothetical protein
MRTLLTLLSALLAYATVVYATALTYRLEAHEKACFFAHVENKGTKLAFYFAVRSPPGPWMRNCPRAIFCFSIRLEFATQQHEEA